MKRLKSIFTATLLVTMLIVTVTTFAVPNSFLFSRVYTQEKASPAPKDTVKKTKPRYSVRHTSTETTDDVKHRSSDLKDPDNLKTEVTYDEKNNVYEIGTTLEDNSKDGKKTDSKDSKKQSSRSGNSSSSSSTNGKSSSSSTSTDKNATNVKMGSYLAGNQNGMTLGTATSYLTAPILMTPEEYQKWSLQESMAQYYRDRNAELYTNSGKSKFDFTDMHFDLGPAEKIFGPGGVQIKTQGSAELKLGLNVKNVDNPAIAVDRRKTTAFDFDMKVNMTLNGKVGDKINMNLNYNTESTFDYDAQNLKLKYEGKEDEIIKLLEVGNVSMPSNNGLIPGVSSLFGLRTDLQFGKLKLQTVISQKNSASKTVNSQGGTSTNDFEISAADYEENRHFFLSHFFREKYGKSMKTLPTIASGITITRSEVWVTNKTGSTTNNRNIIAFADLGEPKVIREVGGVPLWDPTGQVPDNRANLEYTTIVNDNDSVRDISKASDILDNKLGLVGGMDYEKLQSARLLSSSEYRISTSLGYISLTTTLQPDEILAIAYEYTYNGTTYQVGEFSSDMKDTDKALYVKLLKGSVLSHEYTSWNLMMRNVYSLGASTTQKTKFKLDVKYQSDSTGVYLTYLPDSTLKKTPLLRALGLDRLDNNNKPNSNGQFDYVDGYTIYKGRVYFPVVEPFGEDLSDWIDDPELAKKYVFQELYDTTKTVAKQNAEKNKYILTGHYVGTSANEIDLGVTNIAQGSVVVTAGGVVLTENTDYTVDYGMGHVTIINQSIIDSGQSVSASVESNDTYGMQKKTFLGFNADYQFNKYFTLGATVQYLSEQPLTTKVAMGSEPLKNVLWGAHLSWKHEAQWLTNLVNKIPFINCTAPSQISLDAEVAQLVAGQSSATQGDASYLDDFENSQNKTSLIQPTYWQLSSRPTNILPFTPTDTISYGYDRANIALYCVDDIFTNRASSLTPAYIKSNTDYVSNHYVREVYERELYPQKAQTSYSSANDIQCMNIAYYPKERGPYNLTRELTPDGTLKDSINSWGGVMRKMDNTDFETQNIEYIEFWLMDPFIYEKKKGIPVTGGDMYIDLGEVSEDILKDGKKFFESGMPIDGDSKYYTTTAWGRVPNSTSVTYAFNNESGSRARQDVGLDGLTDAEEKEFSTYQKYLQDVKGILNETADSIVRSDPANDNFHYFRGTDYDNAQLPILDRYKRISLPQGNSADSETSLESYETAWKTTPDVEDINTDYTLNEYERFFRYHFRVTPQDLETIGRNFITDKRVATVKLRNNNTDEVTWYQVRIPLQEFEKPYGSITDFSSIRFMRLFLTQFKDPIVLRFATFDLVSGDWRPYNQALSTTNYSDAATFEVSTVNIEENNDRVPVNYVLPPGISRVTDPSQSQLVESNEQALCMIVKNLMPGDSRAVYKNCKYDMRKYKHIQLFSHANALTNDATNLKNGDVSIFMRLGSDYKNNYYEYEVPLTLTPEGNYDTYTTQGRLAVWPESNMMDFDLDEFTNLKTQRNKFKSMGMASFNKVYSGYDSDHPNNRVSVMGNPSLGEVKTIMIGIRNNGITVKEAEVWANELRLQEFTNEGGWAAQGTLNVQLSDIGSFNATGKVVTAGYGGIEQTVEDRSEENTYQYNFTTNVDLGRLLPRAAKLSFPIYYSYGKNIIKPKYNTLDTDILLSDALDALQTQTEKDSLESLNTQKTTTENFSISGAKLNFANKKHPMPYDPANFTFSYSFNNVTKTGSTTVYEYENSWKFAMNYSWSPNWKSWEPFKNLKSKSKWLQLVKDQNLAFCPQSVTFSTDLSRTYNELQERDLDDIENPQSIPVTWSSSFLWNRQLSLRWDIFKALHFTFQSATHAEIEEPYTVVNKDLYPDRYEAWKDSVKNSLLHMGRPLDYNQQVQISYKLPINKIPCFDWITTDGTYSSTYTWKRGTETTEGVSLGNTINTQRTVNVNGKLSMETLYNHSKFLQATNKKFSSSSANSNAKKKKEEKKKADEAKKKEKEEQAKARASAEEESKKTGVPVDSILARNTKNLAQSNAKGKSQQKDTKKKTKGFAMDLLLKPDSNMVVNHNQKSKHLIVKALDPKGHELKLKYKKLDENKIAIKTSPEDTFKIRLNVSAKPTAADQKWYKYAQAGARFMMMLRDVSVSYRNTYNLMLPGFKPEVGDLLGQHMTPNNGFTPGVDFAFGFIDDSYIDKALSNQWLLKDSALSTPATTSSTEDLQIKATLEPFTDFKIDLNMSRTMNRSKSIQYMYDNCPTTHTGSFNMTTITIGSAFEGIGSASDGYDSPTFNRFVQNLITMRDRVESRYIGTQYPKRTGLSGEFDPTSTPVSQYQSDVMIPAFLAAYTGGNAASSPLDIFPSLLKMLPNWSISYKGLGTLPWVRDHFKSVTLSHSYKSVYSVGSYNSYASWIEYMGGSDMGYASNTTTGSYSPTSMYDISTVSINEAFSPLIGLNFTFNNNMSLKAEYKKARVVNLSITSAQINETGSDDFVIGWGWKINDFRLSSLFGSSSKASLKALKSTNRNSAMKSTTKDDGSTSNSSNSKNGKSGTNSKNAFAHDLNMRFDFSLRNQSAIRRDIQTGLSEATSGNMALKVSTKVDYTMSRYVTASLYYDIQRSKPLLTSSSYPTITQDFGFSMKFSLTR